MQKGAFTYDVRLLGRFQHLDTKSFYNFDPNKKTTTAFMFNPYSNSHPQQNKNLISKNKLKRIHCFKIYPVL